MATHSSILAWKIPWSLVGFSPQGHQESDRTEAPEQYSIVWLDHILFIQSSAKYKKIVYVFTHSTNFPEYSYLIWGNLWGSKQNSQKQEDFGCSQKSRHLGFTGVCAEDLVSGHGVKRSLSIWSKSADCDFAK